jgi:hypothetical protein
MEIKKKEFCWNLSLVKIEINFVKYLKLPISNGFIWSYSFKWDCLTFEISIEICEIDSWAENVDFEG